MRQIVLIAAATACLSGCMIMPSGSPPDPRYPAPQGDLEPIDPYKTDDIPSTAYEIWKRDKERNERVAGQGGDTYPPLFKGQRDDNGTSSQ